MKFLLSNDDGYFAPGINELAHTLSSIGEVVIVAPEENKSASSSSLTLKNPLTITEHKKNIYYINGTPTDCVHIALSGFLKFKPDMVISGINDGPNMGDDTIYSGTVAAAMEGYLLDIPSLAVSMSQYDPKYYATAGQVVLGLIPKIKDLQQSMLLNINVPDLPYDQLKGLEITRLGKRHKAEPIIHHPNQNNKLMYWVGAAGEPNDGGPGTDFFAIKNEKISISPIISDLTNFNKLDLLKENLI
ncbi:stationary phase survival protein SurE [Methylophilales bacterium MBRSG12]|uniref:5'-nucleotidase SurE n=1 Tax=Methylophilales bacterium MBRS-H7 TaxID=1623450 RepID=A0A0H4J296_9PROT|nr:stationary phase survival protein SurE [Methylophilales bacterium MBRSF5]AKO66170.1 stationary phase survival protein SurE [Methylophilales bacterium MBRS-H7]AKO67489.1 stationary phase survival protein SurE [Methylophilales bacterium MBRSG12]